LPRRPCSTAGRPDGIAGTPRGPSPATHVSGGGGEARSRWSRCLVNSVHGRLRSAGARLPGGSTFWTPGLTSARTGLVGVAAQLGAVIEQMFGARPTGFERADAISIRIPIGGADIGLIAEGA
jgi:hypothetical protein